MLVDLATLLLSYKTYLAAAGLAGLAIYQFSLGEYQTAWTTLLAALAAAGLRHETAPEPPRDREFETEEIPYGTR